MVSLSEGQRKLALFTVVPGILVGWRAVVFDFGLLLCCLAVASPAWAVDVVLAGVFPGKALLVINGGAPQALGEGSMTREGIRVMSVASDSVVIEVNGRRERIRLGDGAVHLNGGGGSSPAMSIFADGRGQFHATGAVNGVTVQFIVDTGATFVSLGRSDALRAGIEYGKGQSVSLQTANGVIPAWQVTLDSVKLGEITLRNVEGIVQATDLPFVLLGASFLNRMEMRRDGSALQLKRRY